MTAPTFPDYARALADELGIRLEPWQAHALDNLAAGRQVIRLLDPGAGATQRRAHRRWIAAAYVAAAAIAGHAPDVVSADADAIYAEALQLLEVYARTCKVDLGLATETLLAAMR